MQVRQTFTLYRITWENPPTLDDMKSNEALGKRPRGDDPEVLRLWSGISLWDSMERARAKAARNPWKGNAFIAELVIPAGQFELERTLRSGHHMLWGDPHDILDCVRRVERA